MGEHPRVSIVVAEFLVIDFLLVYKLVIGCLTLKILKLVTSIYYLTMKFPTPDEMKHV